MRLLGLILSLSILVFSCTKDSSNTNSLDGGTGEDGTPTFIPSDGSPFSSDCGTLVNGDFENPVNPNDGLLINASVAAPNVVIGQLQNGPALIKLSGLADVESFRDNAAMNFLRGKLSQGPVIFYESTEDCFERIRGGTALVGELFTMAGENISESLIKAGLARVDKFDDCVVDELTACYDALVEMSPQVGGVVSNFLWKPVSEKDGNLVVLLSPFNSTIKVDGRTLRSTGASNGRGTTARGDRPGCAYGRAVVTVFDSEGNIILFPNGKRSLTIENGCDRVEVG